MKAYTYIPVCLSPQVARTKINEIETVPSLKSEAEPARELVRTGLRWTWVTIEEINANELLPKLGTGLSMRILWSGFHGSARALMVVCQGE